MTSEDALSTVGVGESSSDKSVSWPESPLCWLNLGWGWTWTWTTGILTGGPLEAVEDDDEELEGEVALEESDWVKLLRRSSFSRVRSPSILAKGGIDLFLRNDWVHQPAMTKVNKSTRAVFFRAPLAKQFWQTTSNLGHDKLELFCAAQ